MPTLLTTCDSCTHWAPDLGPTVVGVEPGGRTGTCRERLQVFQFGQDTPRGLVVSHQVYYPTVPAKFPTCGQYRPAISVS